jgi:hypothetical protein
MGLDLRDTFGRRRLWEGNYIKKNFQAKQRLRLSPEQRFGNGPSPAREE